MSKFINTIDVLGDSVVFDSIVDRSITEFKDDVVTSIGHSAFHSCANLTVVDLPNATSIGQNAFYKCTNLTAINLPNVISMGYDAIYESTNLTIVDLPNVTNLGGSGFYKCTNLKTLILRSSTVCVLGNSFMFNMPGLRDGYIYVPRELVDSYKSATNWSKAADRFRALEDYTVDGTTTGALDETKI